MQQVSLRLAEQLGDDVHLNAPVRMVRWNEDGVTVEADGGIEVQAKRVVLAVPPNLYSRMSFDPPLPRRQHQMHMHQSLIALMIIDIDGFKRINGALGIEQGDKTLKRIANRLRLALAPGETLLRLGGDEFSVILPGLTSPATARE